jgi:hypothetical protein
MTKKLKDWTKQIEGLADIGDEDTLNLYSEMLATAHDIGYKVPDEQLIETEDASKLREVIPPLHEGIKAFHAQAQAEANTKKARAAAPAETPEPIVKKARAKKTAPKKPGKPPVQKDVTKETNMAAATAKKVAPKKSAAKKAAPAKKAAKKASSENARTRLDDNAKIVWKADSVPGREGSGVFERLSLLKKNNGKTVATFVKAGGRTSTVHKAKAKGWIDLK